MKRHPALEPFSRDHFVGLSLARALTAGQPDAGQKARRAWDVELKDHFEEEERLLAPLLSTELVDRLKREHIRIAELITGLPENTALLGELLERHIRWEERVLFPAIEGGASEQQMNRLKQETDILEERRWLHSPKRRERVTKNRPPSGMA
jgi:iron-sulfur cluster repair protein YtfE (RIC family)